MYNPHTGAKSGGTVVGNLTAGCICAFNGLPSANISRASIAAIPGKRVRQRNEGLAWGARAHSSMLCPGASQITRVYQPQFTQLCVNIVRLLNSERAARLGHREQGGCFRGAARLRWPRLACPSGRGGRTDRLPVESG
eukprot:SAG11_NODE_4834_length_1750_cov_1.577226_1_plen_138_part_00